MPIKKESADKIGSSSKKPKVSIPSDGDTVCQSIIYDVGFTKTAEKNAQADSREPNLFDGIYVKFAHCKYWDKDGKEHQTLDYSDPKVIKFPKDIGEGDDKVKCWIQNEDYLSVGRVTSKFGGYKKPDNIADLLVIYDLTLSSQFGINPGVLIDLCLSSGLVKLEPADMERVGISVPSTWEYPIINLYRYMDKKMNNLTGKEGPSVSLTGRNRSTNQYDLGTDVVYVPMETGIAVYDALVQRAAKKKDDTPF